MLRTNVTRNVRLFAPRRLLSTTPRVMAGGDTGSGFSRASGERAGYVDLSLLAFGMNSILEG